MSRRFILERQTDVSGISGTGTVVEGVEFSDGSCSIHWLSGIKTWTTFASVDDVVKIHGHEGATNIVWLDHE